MSRKTQKSKGLGDTVENVFKTTGIDKVAKFILGDDCNCDKRKELLNKLVPYKKANCLNEDQYSYLNEYFKENKSTLDLKQQRELSNIYKSVFNISIQSTNCSSCWRDYIADLKKVYNEYAK